MIWSTGVDCSFLPLPADWHSIASVVYVVYSSMSYRLLARRMVQHVGSLRVMSTGTHECPRFPACESLSCRGSAAGAITTADLERYKQKLADGALTAGLNYYRAAIDSVTWNKPEPRSSQSRCWDLQGWIECVCSVSDLDMWGKTQWFWPPEGDMCWRTTQP